MTDQRKVESLANSRYRDPVFFDDFEDLFQDIDIDTHTKILKTLNQMEEKNFLKRMITNYAHWRSSGKNIWKIHIWSEIIFERLLRYTDSIEFVSSKHQILNFSNGHPARFSCSI